jgi:hypothetical protein
MKRFMITLLVSTLGFTGCTVGVETSDGAPITAAPVVTSAPAEADPPAEPDAPIEPEAGDEGATLCDAYLSYLRVGDTSALEEALGADVPPRLITAIEVLNASDVDYLDILQAGDSLSDYVSPVCRDRWDETLAPAASDAEAVDALFTAIVAGDESGAIAISPADVRAIFEPWAPTEPDADLGAAQLLYDEGAGDFVMLLKPTVSVFCTINEGIVTSCAYGA